MQTQGGPRRGAGLTPGVPVSWKGATRETPRDAGPEETSWEGPPLGRAGTFLRLDRDVGRSRLGAALALLAALAVDGVVGLQLTVRLLRAGQGAEDPVPRVPEGTSRIRPSPGPVLQQVGAGAGGLRGCSHLGLAWRGEQCVNIGPTAPAAL